MDLNAVLNDTKTKFQSAVSHFEGELKKVRTGRAHPSMLDGVMVTAYGAPMPLNQVSNISTPEPQLLQITPFDPNNLQAIASAIRDNPNLGMNPMDDGRVVRVSIPPLTEERRKEYVKVVGNKLEDCMITLRGIRHDSMDSVNKAKKDKQVGEDDAKRYEKLIDEAMAQVKSSVETLAKAKEDEIMKI